MNLLAITSYYNPLKGKLRKENYDIFRKFLGLELLTVEWSRDGEFELCEKDAEYLIQASGGDLLWQKERLLNIGLERAKTLGFSKVAFLDCDIVFSNLKWFENVNAALENYSILQCYSHVNYLPSMNCLGMSREDIIGTNPEYSLPSFAHGIIKNNGSMFVPINPEVTSPIPGICGNPGMAVAIRIDRNSRWYHYEGNIVGGADILLMAGVANCLEDYMHSRKYSPAHKEHILKWRDEHFHANCKLGYADNTVFHLWHGKIEKMDYRKRVLILTECEYDPPKDLNLEEAGALSFASKDSDLKERVAEYLFSRQDS